MEHPIPTDNRAMTGAELHRLVTQAMRWDMRDFAALLAVDESTCRKWVKGVRPVPEPVAAWLRETARRFLASPPPSRPAPDGGGPRPRGRPPGTTSAASTTSGAASPAQGPAAPAAASAAPRARPRAASASQRRA